MRISEAPVAFDPFKWQYETLEVRDLHFSCTYLQQRNPDLSYALSTPQGEVFGVIRAVRISSHAMPTAEQIEQAFKEESILVLPY